VDSDVPVMVTV